MNVEELIAKRLAAPKRFRVVTAYESGVEKTHDTETFKQARNWADLEVRKIDKPLIDLDTGETVRVVSVEITDIPA